MRETESRGLQECASSHGGAASHDSSTSTKRITNEDTDDSTDETSQVVRCDCDALVERELFSLGITFRKSAWVDFRKVLSERREIQKTSCNSLVITEEPFKRAVSGSRLVLAENEATYKKSRLPRELMARLRARPLMPKYFGMPNMVAYSHRSTARYGKV